MSAKRWLHLLGACLVACALMAGAGPARAQGQVMVFAAASTTNAMQDLGELFAQQAGSEVVSSFASSGVLAKQIEQGAPAGVFLSANVKWMDWLEQAGAIAPGTRRDLLGNRLVLIAPADSPLGEVDLAAGTDLAALLGDGRLAVGETMSVPAGIYAKEALIALKLWGSVRGKLAQASNVRAALGMVQSGEAPLGVVYATDAKISDAVKVVGVFPEGSHKPIVYPVAVVKDQDTDPARRYLEFLASDQAAAVFKKYGFVPLAQPSR